MKVRISKKEQESVLVFEYTIGYRDLELIVEVFDKMGMLPAVKVLGLMAPNLTTIEKVDIIRKITE